MPFYRYECESCGHEFRVLQPAGSDEPVSCPKCKAETTRRMLPRVSVQFKGSGYYKTDRAKSRSKIGTKDSSPDKPSTADSKESKESKESKSDKSTSNSE